jgi:hypothetical protein
MLRLFHIAGFSVIKMYWKSVPSAAERMVYHIDSGGETVL